MKRDRVRHDLLIPSPNMASKFSPEGFSVQSPAARGCPWHEPAIPAILVVTWLGSTCSNGLPRNSLLKDSSDGQLAEKGAELLGFMDDEAEEGILSGAGRFFALPFGREAEVVSTNVLPVLGDPRPNGSTSTKNSGLRRCFTAALAAFLALEGTDKRDRPGTTGYAASSAGLTMFLAPNRDPNSLDDRPAVISIVSGALRCCESESLQELNPTHASAPSLPS